MDVAWAWRGRHLLVAWSRLARDAEKAPTWPWRGQHLFSPQGQRLSSLIKDCQTNTFIISVPLVGEVMIAQKLGLILWREVLAEFSKCRSKWQPNSSPLPTRTGVDKYYLSVATAWRVEHRARHRSWSHSSQRMKDASFLFTASALPGGGRTRFKSCRWSRGSVSSAGSKRHRAVNEDGLSCCQHSTKWKFF